MRRHEYKPRTPRVALGLAAIAMAAITIVALVVLPAESEAIGADSSPATATRWSATASFESRALADSNV